MLDPSSPVLARAGAIAHSVWVTPYAADERWPCGEFPNLGDGGLGAAGTGTGSAGTGSDGGPGGEPGEGLPAWTSADRSIDNVDVVLWYVFGIHHVTRPEDWPVMPADTVSFWLKPFGFFDRNPALDVPPSAADHCS
jgi:primary-amine oxidase